MKLSNRLPVILLFLTTNFIFLHSFAQSPIRHRCGSQYVLEEMYKKNPALKDIVAKERARLVAEAKKQNSLIKARTGFTLTIPVVVHIVLPNTGIISNAQVISQIDALNTDYAGLNGDSTNIPAAFKPFFGKGRIRFCLANRTPTGQATTGIIRKNSSIAFNPDDPNGDPIKFSDRGGSDAWDPTQYLNIWVGDDDLTVEDFGYLGYSYTPAIPLSAIPLNERGFVNHYLCFGKKTGTASAPFNLGRTAVHEIGHFFNLEHIWGPSNCDGTDVCTDDDGISDTPEQEACNYGTPVFPFTDNCTKTSPGIMWMNYMDYVDDKSMVMYTPQQYARMESTLFYVSWMQNLANANGCLPPQTYERDVRLSSLTNALNSVNSSFLYTCSNNYQPNIRVRNLGTTAVNSMRIEAKINDGTSIITDWSGSLNPGAETSINLNPILLNNGANNNLTIEITLVNGLADQNSVNNAFYSAGIIYPLVLTLPLTEGFESATFPSSNWRLLNPDLDFSWERSTKAAKTGKASMFFDNFNSEDYDLSDWIISPFIPAKGKDSIFMTFQIAAATYSQPSTIVFDPTDTLEILVTTDCGTSYTSKYKKSGLSLVTTGDVEVTSYFIPSSSQWRKDSVFIGFYDNSGPDQIQIAFKNTTNWGNNIYIDDINIFNKSRNATGVGDTDNNQISKIKVYPNPVNKDLIVDHKSINKLVPYRIVNIFGQQIKSGILQNEKTIVDFSSYPSGVYFFYVNNGAIKLIKK